MRTAILLASTLALVSLLVVACTPAPSGTPARAAPPQHASVGGGALPLPSTSAAANGSDGATAPAAAAPTTPSLHDVLDPHVLPLGDGKVSSTPEAGYVDSCVQSFSGGGAQHEGDWVHGDTWDLTQKLAVEGAVSWPQAQFSITTQGDRRVITGNDLPVGAVTGTFPIQASDPAYQIDRNPNSVEAQQVSFSIPADPQVAAQPSCVPMGMIGVALDGVAIFNALDADGRDAVAHEVQDACDGHPQSGGIYHYHGPSECMPHVNETVALVGYALDGFGIYSGYDANGTEITDEQLDACHGMTSVVPWDGENVSMYHYVLTREYPYTIGCYRGTPVRVALGQDEGQPQRPVGGLPLRTG